MVWHVPWPDPGAMPRVDNDVSSLASDHSCGASVASLDGNPQGAPQGHATAGLPAALLEAHNAQEEQQRYVPSLAGTASPRSGAASLPGTVRDGSEASLECIDGSTCSSSAAGGLHVLPNPACALDPFCLCLEHSLRIFVPTHWFPSVLVPLSSSMWATRAEFTFCLSFASVHRPGSLSRCQARRERCPSFSSLACPFPRAGHACPQEKQLARGSQEK